MERYENIPEQWYIADSMGVGGEKTLGNDLRVRGLRCESLISDLVAVPRQIRAGQPKHNPYGTFLRRHFAANHNSGRADDRDGNRIGDCGRLWLYGVT